MSRKSIVVVLNTRAIYHELPADAVGREVVFHAYRSSMLNAKTITAKRYEKVESYYKTLQNEPPDSRLSNALRTQAQRTDETEKVVNTILEQAVINMPELQSRDLVNLLKLRLLIGKQRLQEIKLDSEILLKITSVGVENAGGTTTEGTGEATEESIKEIGEFLGESSE